MRVGGCLFGGDTTINGGVTVVAGEGTLGIGAGDSGDAGVLGTLGSGAGGAVGCGTLRTGAGGAWLMIVVGIVILGFAIVVADGGVREDGALGMASGGGGGGRSAMR